MSFRTLIAGALALLLSSCSSLVATYLINNYLNDKAPIFTWRGTVVDSENRGIPDATVRVRAEVADDDNVLDFTGLTDGTGHYQVQFKYSAKVSYRVSVLVDDVVVAERNVGSVSKGDQRDDFVVDSAGTQLQVSGVVTDADGDPVKDALVLVGSAASEGGAVSLFKDGSDPAFVKTSDSGVFQLEGSANQHVVAVAFDPEHGFAYATGQDEDDDGDLGLNLRMGAIGTHTVDVQVVDGSGDPIVSQVLEPSRQFRLRLRTPYDLSEEVDGVVADNALFPELDGLPSDLQPTQKLFTVQSTDINGMADGELSAVGGAYNLDVLKRDSLDPATAIVQSNNPLALAGDSTVVVRVN
jgi:hypothetical protein